MTERNHFSDHHVDSEHDETEQNHMDNIILCIVIVLIVQRNADPFIALGEQPADERIDDPQDWTSEQINQAIQCPSEQSEITILIICGLIFLLWNSPFVAYLPSIIFAIIAYSHLMDNSQSIQPPLRSRSINEYPIPAIYFNANRDAQEENRVALSEDIIFSNTVEEPRATDLEVDDLNHEAIIPNIQNEVNVQDTTDGNNLIIDDEPRGRSLSTTTNIVTDAPLNQADTTDEQLVITIPSLRNEVHEVESNISNPNDIILCDNISSTNSTTSTHIPKPIDTIQLTPESSDEENT